MALWEVQRASTKKTTDAKGYVCGKGTWGLLLERRPVGGRFSQQESFLLFLPMKPSLS